MNPDDLERLRRQQEQGGPFGLLIDTAGDVAESGIGHALHAAADTAGAVMGGLNSIAHDGIEIAGQAVGAILEHGGEVAGAIAEHGGDITGAVVEGVIGIIGGLLDN